MSIYQPKSRFHKDVDNNPISRSSHFDEWKQIRRFAISATDATKLIKKNGDKSSQAFDLLWRKIAGSESDHFASYDLGIERESIIAQWVLEQYPDEYFEPNDVLYCAENNRHVATPDLVGCDSVCEIKVSSKPLKSIMGRYLDQIQWQMYVLDKPLALFVVENRETQLVETEWIHRDDERISALTAAADLFLRELDERMQNVEPESKDSDSFFDLSLDEDLQIYFGVPGNIETEIEELNWQQTADCLRLYCQNKSLWELSDELNLDINAIATSMARAIFALQGDLADSDAVNFMQSWTAKDFDSLARMYRSSKSVDEMAELLGRDRLGVVHKILELYSPPVPKIILLAYGVEGES